MCVEVRGRCQVPTVTLHLSFETGRQYLCEWPHWLASELQGVGDIRRDAAALLGGRGSCLLKLGIAKGLVKGEASGSSQNTRGFHGISRVL